MTRVSNQFPSKTKSPSQRRLWIGAGIACLACFAGAYWYITSGSVPESTRVDAAAKIGPDKLRMTAPQVRELDVGEVASHTFEQQRVAIGIVDFNQDSVVQVFAPYQGRIGRIFVKAGDDVISGQVLYTVQIPDLAQAGATLISSAGVFKSTTETVTRAKALYETQSISLKEYQQNISDQQAADAAYRAARKTMTLFGLSEAAIDEMETSRKVETEMPVLSPFAGRITARAGAVGQLVQPGNAPAPITIANVKKLWMIASVPETELPAYRVGQDVKVRMQAFPDKTFAAKVSYVGDSVDPNTHRIQVRAEIADPEHLLRPQMLATFTITVGNPITSPALPQGALVRESDGSTSVWVAEDATNFTRRIVKTGMTQDNFVQVTEGIKLGERVARDKALFLSNLYLTSTN